MINRNDYNKEELEKWVSFRNSLSSLFPNRTSAVMNLIDSLSSNYSAKTAVQLSENDLFHYNYNSLYKAINNSFSFSSWQKKEHLLAQQKLIISTLNTPDKLPFHLFAIDTTSIERSHSPTLIDREFIYKPSSIFGRKPITLGHKYSVLTYLTHDEKTQHNWSIPLSTERVDSCSTDSKIGWEQVNILLNNCSEFKDGNLSVIVADSHYSNQHFLGDLTNQKNLVTITRSRSNRVFYTLPKMNNNQKKTRGHPCWYGDKFDLKNESTWHEVDEEFSDLITNNKKEIFSLNIKCWNNLIMKGDKEEKMWQKPFRLLRISLKDKNGNLKLKPMWLIVMGKKALELNLFDCYKAYLRRFDIEHLFRFVKNKLLLNNYYTPEVKREQNWVELVFLSYVNLWATRNLALNITSDWEKYYHKKIPSKITPTMVQKDYKRIIRTFGEEVVLPKVRGYSSGREKGKKLPPRLRYPIVKKTSRKKKTA